VAQPTVGAAGERLPDPSGEATVVLDIGLFRGALVIYLPAALDGREVEVRPQGAPWTGRHTAVRRRDVRSGSCFAAVFDSLGTGVYQLRLCGSGTEPVLHVAVEAGRVTEADWPDDADAHPVGVGADTHQPSP
jgi:hypothetical protein